MSEFLLFSIVLFAIIVVVFLHITWARIDTLEEWIEYLKENKVSINRPSTRTPNSRGGY